MLKKYRYIILVQLAVFFSIPLFSQPNFIIRQDAAWSTLEIHCQPQGNSYSSFYLKFMGDTLVDGIHYNKMYVTYDENQLYWELLGLAREDGDHKVYFRPPDYLEGMVYDFGCSLADTVETVNYFLNSDTMRYTVTSIDTVFLMDNMPRKRITLTTLDNLYQEVWVEGLGNFSGILFSGNGATGGVCGSYAALCFHENDVMVFQNPAYNICFLSGIVGTPDLSRDVFSLQPNPVNDQVKVVTAKNGQYRIEIFGTDGSRVTDKTFHGPEWVNDISWLPSGLYICRITSSTGESRINKFIKG